MGSWQFERHGEMAIKKCVLICGAVAVLVCGCATNQVDLVKAGELSLETEPGERIRILDAYVYQKGAEEVVVTAAVKRRRPSSQPMKIHVTMTILTPAGEQIEMQPDEFYVPAFRPGKTRSIKYYRKRLEEMPPKGSTIRLTCR